MLAGLLVAQGQETGGLRGSVVDAELAFPLEGAVVRLLESGATAKTDESGNFFFRDLKAGTYTLRGDLQGFVGETLSNVRVNAGQMSERTLALTAEVVTLDEFVVRGSDFEEESGAVAMLEIRQSLDSFADVLDSDFFSRAGSSDVGGALTKVAGTSVVDSRYVVVRGLGDRYNVVVLNGARIPSSDPDKRAVNVDIFPTDLVETLVTSKTFIPEFPGEATGGYIDIVTKSIPTEPFFSMSHSLGYNTASTGNPNFLQYRGGGTGIFGSAESRPLPQFLVGTNRVSGSLPTTSFSITEPPIGAVNANNLQSRQLRADAADFFRGTTMGVTTGEAPFDFSFDASAGTRIEFAGRPLGLLAAVTYSKDYRLKSGVRGKANLGSGNNQLTQLLEYSEGEEELLAGLLLGAGYQLNENSTLAVTFFTNVAASDSAIFQIGEDGSVGSNPNDRTKLDDENELLIKEGLVYVERRLSTFQLAGDHLLGDVGGGSLDWTAAYSMSSQNEPDQRFSNHSFTRSTGEWSSLGADFSGPPFERLWRRLDDTNYNLDAKIDVPLFSDGKGTRKAVASFGGAFDHSTRDFASENFAYAFNTDQVPEWPNSATPVPSDSAGLTPGDVLPSVDLVDTLVQDIGGTGSQIITDQTFITRPSFPAPAESYTATQNIFGAFGQVRFDLTKNLELLFGARFESTDIDIQTGINAASLNQAISSGALIVDLATGERFTLDELNNPRITQTDVLPAAGINYDLSDDMKLRFSATKTVARPTFKEVAPVNTRDPGSSDFVAGNPNLRMSDITNVDLRWEWFPERGDLFAVSAFTKDIRNPIEVFTSGSVRQFGNEVSAVLYGFELEARKGFGSLAPELEPISIGFNYANITSQTELTENSITNRGNVGLSTDRPLQGQPNYTMNFDLSYSSEEHGVTGSLLLNVTGQLLYLVGANDGQDVSDDILQQPFTSLDFTLSKKLNDRFKLGFKASNLLNSPVERVYQNGLLPYSILDEGTSFSLSISGEW